MLFLGGVILRKRSCVDSLVLVPCTGVSRWVLLTEGLSYLDATLVGISSGTWLRIAVGLLIVGYARTAVASRYRDVVEGCCYEHSLVTVSVADLTLGSKQNGCCFPYLQHFDVGTTACWEWADLVKADPMRVDLICVPQAGQGRAPLES